jgi:hypothetical protein
LYNEKLHNFYSSPTIIWVINPGRSGWGVRHTWMGREMYAEVGWGNLKERDHLEGLRIYHKIILK